MSTLREALTAAVEASDSESTTTEAPVAATTTASEPASPGETSTAAERARDEGGRFAKAAAAAKAETKTAAPRGIVKPTPVAETPKPTNGATSTTQAPAPTLKAPQSWKPDIREKHWATTSPEVQAEIHRREKEIESALREAAAPRDFHAKFNQALAPYEGLLRTLNPGAQYDPIQAVMGPVQTLLALQTAPPHQKAQLIAQAIHQYGVPIDVLDQVLAGQAPTHHAPGAQTHGMTQAQIDSMVDERVNKSLQQRDQQQAHAMASAEIERFSPGKEFLEDVRADMALVMRSATQRGVAISLDDAYNRACELNPDVSKVLSQRKAAEAANVQQASTQRAKAAASSVKSSPVGDVSPVKPGSLREQLEAAFEGAGR